MLNLMHKLKSFTDVTIYSDNNENGAAGHEDNFVVPVSRLDGYDYSTDADS